MVPGRHRLIVCLVGTAFVGVGCASDGADRTAESSAVTSSTTTSSTTVPRTDPEPEPTSAPTTTIDPDTAAGDVEAARAALLDLVATDGAVLTSLHGGSLRANGAIATQQNPFAIPALQLDARVIVDEGGAVWFAVFGAPDVVANTWFEFDGVAGDGRTVGVQSSVAANGAGPAWVNDVDVGSVVTLTTPGGSEPQSLRAPPALPTQAVGPDLTGYLVLSDLAVSDGVLVAGPDVSADAPAMPRLSTWAYRDVATLAEPPPAAAWVYRAFDDRASELPAATALQPAIERWRDSLDGAADVLDGAAAIMAANDDRLVWVAPLDN